nr:bifunctional hydroxymethylpyrimidine kinase/phosphomethylpyrimidine kinase [Saprospiraceae bacterium]
MSLLAVGTVAIDSIETPLGKAERVVGGAATYIAWAASYFTDQIRILSIIGEDFPQPELELLKSKGVDTEGIHLIKGGKSFFWSGRYSTDMNSRDTLETQLNVLADFAPDLPSAYKNSKYLMLGNLTPAVQMSVLNQMESRPDIIAMDTMNFWMDSAMGELLEVIKRVDILTINDEEARQLSGQQSLAKAARDILKMGPKYLIIKKGEHGALLFDNDQVFFAPALPLYDVFDPTGAGDTFAGGMMGYLSQKGELSFSNLKTAIIYGSAMASFCVEEFGINKLKELTDEEIKIRLKKFIDLVHFEL